MLRGELIGQLGPSRLLNAGHWPREGSSDKSLVRLACSLATLQAFSLEEKPGERKSEGKNQDCRVILATEKTVS